MALLTAIAAAFLGGLILNFMPCVFPVISLKVLGVVRHGQNPRAVRAEALAYLAGVVLTMLLLAGALLALRAAGAAVGWGFQLQSPLVIAVLALVILGAALNLMGLFEVGAGAQRLGNLQTTQDGPLAAALTGVLAIVVATPCTAPFMASAVGYAIVQPPWVALAVFLALALGFAAPFVVIAWVPAIGRRLPRPGPWMAVLKQLLAFPMLAAAAWLAWVLARQAGANALATLLAACIVLAFGAWLYGLASQRRLQGLRGYRGLFAGVAVAGVALVAMLGTLPGTTHGTATPTAVQAAEAWTPQKVAEQRGKGHAIFVNFTADWCVTCQVNDRAALSTQAVKDAIARTGTLYMVADSTQFNAEVDDALNQFGLGGLPVYLVYPAEGGEPVVLPQLLSPAVVVAALEKAAGKG